VQDLETALKNYFENLPGYTEILGIEESETVQICDLDGEVLPLPLKGIMDLITRDKDGNLIIVDHKCVSFFSDLNQTKAQYELQAGAYFFVAWAIFGERPKAMHFDECLKGEPKAIYPADPTRRLLQADLKELADQNGLQYDKYVKNEQLINMLLEA
jgi:RecB family exonuclease